LKLTDLVGRLAPKYPGMMTRPCVNQDAVELYVPYVFNVKVTEQEFVDTFDDELVELVNDRIQEAVGCADA
jgi:hypothetical protein